MTRTIRRYNEVLAWSDVGTELTQTVCFNRFHRYLIIIAAYLDLNLSQRVAGGPGLGINGNVSSSGDSSLDTSAGP